MIQVWMQQYAKVHYIGTLLEEIVQSTSTQTEPHHRRISKELLQILQPPLIKILFII